MLAIVGKRCHLVRHFPAKYTLMISEDTFLPLTKILSLPSESKGIYMSYSSKQPSCHYRYNQYDPRPQPAMQHRENKVSVGRSTHYLDMKYYHSHKD